MEGKAPREGSLEAPTRHALAWEEESFYDGAALDEETRRVFDICHGCRRCFNLCDSFPRLFDLIDSSETGELDGVSSEGFGAVEEACTLCDMCFMTKCPYVPPHPFAIDFPHLMLRRRAWRRHRGERAPFGARQLTRMDRNAALARFIAPFVNAASARWNKISRLFMEWILRVDRRAPLPRFAFRPLTGFASRARRAKRKGLWRANPKAPAYPKGRKAALFATCYVNHTDPHSGDLMARLLAHCGVEIETVYPTCCGMPFLEAADLGAVAARARKISAALTPLLDKGYEIVSPTASCSLMMRQEWRLLLPEDESVRRLSESVYDISHYLTQIARDEGLPEGAAPIEGGVAAHLACHARAQNVGARGAELLRSLPRTKIHIVERCSGHGGTFGVMKPTHDVARKVARPTVRACAKTGARHIASECPLAARHLADQLALEGSEVEAAHPAVLLARSYGLDEKRRRAGGRAGA